LRHAVGLRDLGARAAQTGDAARKAQSLLAFKQYRESDGRFYFKLVDGERVLLQSIGHASARDAGQLVARLKQEGGTFLRAAGSELHAGGALLGHLPEGIEFAELAEALAQFATADA